MPDYSSGGDHDLLAFVRGEIKPESSMLSSRLGAFLTSQSFLLIAYGSAMSGSLGQWRNLFTLLFPRRWPSSAWYSPIAPGPACGRRPWCWRSGTPGRTS